MSFSLNPEIQMRFPYLDLEQPKASLDRNVFLISLVFVNDITSPKLILYQIVDNLRKISFQDLTSGKPN